jgi:protein-disulfide isomerase
MFFRKLVVPSLLVCLFTFSAAAQTAHRSSTSDSVLRQRIEAFLNRTVGWQGLDQMQVKSIGPADSSGLRKVQVHLSKGDQQADQTYYITADGRRIIQGDVEELSGDPWGTTREKLNRELSGAPAEGPASAPVTLVEFSDLECPHCKNANQVIQQVVGQSGDKLRVVFKSFPLVKIHPWSMAAAIAGVCVTEQNARNFWPFAQAVFDHQEQLTPENAAARLRDFAMESGSNPDQYDACMRSPQARQRVEDSLHQGESVGVISTPTLFINGRKIEGLPADASGRPDPNVLLQLINHEAQVAPRYDRATTGSIATGALKGAQCGHCEAPPPPPK